MEKTNKIDLIECINKKTGIEKKTISIVLDELFEETKKSLSEKKIIELRGFGSFEPKERKGKTNARNPRTGKLVSVKNHYVVSFRAGKELKQLMLDIPVQEKSSDE